MALLEMGDKQGMQSREQYPGAQGCRRVCSLWLLPPGRTQCQVWL